MSEFPGWIDAAFPLTPSIYLDCRRKRGPGKKKKYYWNTETEPPHHCGHGELKGQQTSSQPPCCIQGPKHQTTGMSKNQRCGLSQTLYQTSQTVSRPNSTACRRRSAA